MPINPLIALTPTTPDIGRDISNFADDIIRQRENAEILKRQEEKDRREKEDRQRKIDREIQADIDRNSVESIVKANQALEANDIEEARRIAESRRSYLADIKSKNPDFQFRGNNETEQFVQMLESDPKRALDITRQSIKSFEQMGVLKPQTDTRTADQKNFEFAQKNPGFQKFISATGADNTPATVREWEYFNGLSKDDQGRFLTMKRASKTVDLGGQVVTLAPDGSGEIVSSVDKTVPPEQTPEHKVAVDNAVKMAEETRKQAGEKRSNEAAFNVYNTAMNGLVKGLGGTTTGPFVGWLPAVTTNQQIASGAVAAMAPILKQMFRSSGEGTFTDKDQELLLDMVPTRKDNEAARKSKIENINAIVMAKLGVQPEKSPEAKKPADMSDDELKKELGLN